MTLDRVMEFGGPGLRDALPRRAGHARQHGHRMLGQGRASSRPDEEMLAWIAGAPPRRVRRGAARAGGRPRSRRRSTRAACTSSTSARSGPWSRRRATRRAASPPIPTNGACDRRPRRRAHRHRVRRVLHRGQGSGPRPLRAGHEGSAGRGAAGQGRRRLLSSSSARVGVEEYARAQRLRGRLRAHGGARHPSRLRGLHRLRPRRVAPAPSR